MPLSPSHPQSRERRALALAIGTLLSLLLAACDVQEAPFDAADDGGIEGDSGPHDGGAPSDAAFLGDGGLFDGGADLSDASVGDGGQVVPPPRKIFFVGNSFTFGGPIPDLVEDLAVYAGFPDPQIEYRALGGQTLEGHRADNSPEGAPARVAEGWDALVLQEHSLRPTDQVGPAEQFKLDATYFHDLARTANADCRVVLYETWARRFNHGIYPGTFFDPMQMQAELSAHYENAAFEGIPASSSLTGVGPVEVARAGDAWTLQLADGEPPKLHGDDDYHAGRAGQYLNALVLYSTLYRRRPLGLVPLLGLDEEVVSRLQESADLVVAASGFSAYPGPYFPLPTGARVMVDFGTIAISTWIPMPDIRGTVGPLTEIGGESSSITLTTFNFLGDQEGGQPTNDVGLPDEVGSDSLWTGSFDGHTAALDAEARVILRGLTAGRYELRLFASRLGDDSGRGRLTRYQIASESRDLEVADNRDREAIFASISPDDHGEIMIRVRVSPTGGGRFAYLGSLELTRLPDTP